MEIPYLLTGSCYFWTPANSQGKRKFNSKRNVNKIKTFLLDLGFEVFKEDDYTIRCCKGGIVCRFYYQEEKNRCEKSFQVFVDGVKKDVRIIKKMIKGMED